MAAWLEVEDLEEEEEEEIIPVPPKGQVVYTLLVRAAMVCQAWRAAALEAASDFAELRLNEDTPGDLPASSLVRRMAASVRVLQLYLDGALHRQAGFRQFLQGCSALERLTVQVDNGAMDPLGQAFLESAIAGVPLNQLQCDGFLPVGPLPHFLAQLDIELVVEHGRAGSVRDVLRLQLLLVSIQNDPSLRSVWFAVFSLSLTWVQIDLRRASLSDLRLPQLEVFEMTFTNLYLGYGQVQLGWLGCERSFAFKLGLQQCSLDAAFLADLSAVLQPQDELRLRKCALSSMQRGALTALQIAHIQVDV